jgi:hypothetical protein
VGTDKTQIAARDRPSLEEDSIFMSQFSTGDNVRILFGARRGQIAEIVRVQPAQVYEVKLKDDSFLFFDRMSLKKETTEVALMISAGDFPMGVAMGGELQRRKDGSRCPGQHSVDRPQPTTDDSQFAHIVWPAPCPRAAGNHGSM